MFQHHNTQDTSMCFQEPDSAPCGDGDPDPTHRRRRGGRPLGSLSGHWTGRARRGQLRASILRLLSEQPLNGYQIMTAVAEKTMDAWLPSPGAIYPSLNQLEADGLISATQSDGQKVYTLTEAGATAADQVPQEPWAEWTPTPTQRITMMEQFRNLGITVRFAGQTATPDQLTAIASQLESTRKALLAIMAD